MEGRKKGAKELLEERQMKRYFRSKKRSKGKNKKETDELNEVKKSEITKAISIAAVEDQIGEVQNKDKLMRISSESKNEPPPDDSQKGRVKDDSTEDLSDWEIVPHLAENRSKNIVPETPSDVLSGLESGMDSIEDDLVETIDQNNAWVEEKNKVNDKISSELSKRSEIISVHTNTIIGGEHFENFENEGNKVTKKEHFQEFSPIVYWRDPLPDIACLEMENTRKQEIKYVQKDAPEIIQKEVKEMNKTFENVSPDKGKEDKKKGRTSKSKNADDFSSLGCDSHIMKRVWLDKSKYEDAEVKYYENLARINKAAFSKLSKDSKTTKAMISLKKAEVKHKSVKEKEEKLSLEEQLKRLEFENIDCKQSLTHLSKLVRKLEKRVTNLESRSPSSSMMDEGVDLTGERRCAFFEDCLCHHDDEGTRSSLDNISLDDGSEFEEFIATSTLDNCASGKNTLWQDDWEDISGHDLAAELGSNYLASKN